jgi:effector-binding domain-containing protein
MQIERVSQPAITVAGLSETVKMTELTQFFGRAFGTSAGVLGAAGVPIVGPPVALYLSEPTETVEVTAGFPVPVGTAAPSGLVIETIPAGDAATATHEGPYDSLGATYALLTEWLTQNHLAQAPVMWEEYLVGPDGEEDPTKWRTRIVFPIA